MHLLGRDSHWSDRMGDQSTRAWKKREEGAENFRPECATCAKSLSVQVGSGCHDAGSVNYVIYGVMLRLCHAHLENSTLSKEAPFFTKEQMVRYITLWKILRGAPNLAASLNWAKAGYNGWPSEPTPPAEHPKCAKCPKQLNKSPDRSMAAARSRHLMRSGLLALALALPASLPLVVAEASHGHRSRAVHPRACDDRRDGRRRSV